MKKTVIMLSFEFKQSTKEEQMNIDWAYLRKG